MCRSVLFLSAIIHCTRVLFPIKRHGIRKQRPYANAFLLYAAKFFFWSVCHWSNFELSTDDQHWNGCSRQKRRTQCIYNFIFFRSNFSAHWTIYSATTILEKCRKVVLEKGFCKLGFLFSGQPLFSNLKKLELWYKTTFFFWSTTILEPDFSNQISRTRFLKPDF